MEELNRSILETSQFQAENEIHHLISSAHDSSAASFTALLELPPSQAAHLLHFDNAGGLVFPAEGGLIDRPAKFSVFSSGAVGGSKSSSPETTSDSVAVKCEPPETTDSLNNQSGPLVSDPPAQYVAHLNQRSSKRKEREKKVNDNDNNNNKGAKKKSKSGGAKESSEEAEKLPYVHVRARRGQATDSHSLAERARREKINARMKLLQELVPGCNKISGTALVLDEIINHVQSLQRQVEFLSMRLAAVNPRIDFNLDSLFTVENGSLVESNLSSMIMPMMLPEVQSNGNRQHYQPQWPFDPLHQPVWVQEEECPNFITPENSLLSYDSGNSVSLHSNLVKMEL